MTTDISHVMAIIAAHLKQAPTAIHLRNEGKGAQHSSAIASFRTGSSTGTGTYLVAVPVAIATERGGSSVVPDAVASGREAPSRGV